MQEGATHGLEEVGEVAEAAGVSDVPLVTFDAFRKQAEAFHLDAESMWAWAVLFHQSGDPDWAHHGIKGHPREAQG